MDPFASDEGVARSSGESLKAQCPSLVAGQAVPDQGSTNLAGFTSIVNNYKENLELYGTYATTLHEDGDHMIALGIFFNELDLKMDIDIKAP